MKKKRIRRPNLEYIRIKKKGIQTVIINGHEDKSIVVNRLTGTKLYLIKEGVYECI